MKLYVDPEKVKQRRTEAFFSQRRLAEAANVGQSTIERIERSKDPVGVRYLSVNSIAKALKVSMDDLLVRVEQ